MLDRRSTWWSRQTRHGEWLMWFLSWSGVTEWRTCISERERTQFIFGVTLCPVIFDNSTWPGDLNASIWRMFRKISRCWFWDMATLTPLFWANYKFLWVSCIFGVTLCPVIFDNSTWPGDLNASIWCTFCKIPRSPFWDMATLTPLFWAKFNFFWISWIFGQKYVAKAYFLFSTPYCLSIIQKWASKCMSTL